MIEVHILTALEDNYIYVLHESTTGQNAVVDPSESRPVFQFLEKKKWSLHMILNTHHHHDHVGGNLELKSKFNCPVYCSTHDFSRIPGATHDLKNQNLLKFGSTQFIIMDVPGHTLGAIAYYCAQEKLVFTGDTLFTLGCGRLFEGSAHQLWESLKSLSRLAPDTQVYSGHEYGLQNVGFATLEMPQVPEIKQYFNELKSSCANQIRSVPSSIGKENLLNPFLQVKTLSEFSELRRRKDDFRLEDMGALR